MALTCPNCHFMITEANVNVASDIAKCTACGEVFQPSQVMGGPGAGRAPAQSGEQPPIPDGPPHGTRVVLEDYGDSLSVRFPPTGFSVGILFLMFFAIAWWSFLIVFVVMGVVGSAVMGGLPGLFMLLFLTPFFAVGIGMLFGILWPFFGRTTVRLDRRECTCKSSLFGIGRTHRAPVESTYLRWDQIDFNMHAQLKAVLASHGRVVRHSGTPISPIKLTLGTWEMFLGGSLSRIEQEWVFHEMNEALDGLHR